MGLFSSKKKITVNTTVARVFQDTEIPNSGKQGIFKAILNDGDISDHIMEEFKGSLGIRAEASVLKAERDNYYWGIPKSSTHSAIDARIIVAQTIAALNGPIQVQYNNYGVINSLHWAYDYCIKTWDWDPETNELVKLSAAKGHPVYLFDMVPVYSKDTAEWNAEIFSLGVLENWGFSPLSGYTPSRPYNNVDTIGKYAAQSPYKVDENAIDDALEVTYEWRDSNGMIQKETVKVVMEVDLEADFHQVRYKDKDNKTRFFTYKQGSGVYPAIDGIFEIKYDSIGTYYPFAYFRWDFKNVGYYGAKAFWDCKNWCDGLGVDYEQIANMLDQDPNISDVAQSFMFFGVPPGSQEPEDLEYLFEYFMFLHNNSISQIQKAQILQDKFGDYSNSLDQMIAIYDGHFQMNFAFSGIKYERKTGKVAPVGKFTGAQVTANSSSGQLATVQPGYRYQKQVLDSVYDEVTVFNPNLNYVVSYKKGHVAGIGSKELLIPIDRGLLKTINTRDRERLLARNLWMATNTYQLTINSFFTSSAFRWIMIIVAVVITVFTGGTTWQTIAAAAAVGLTALAIVLLQFIVTSLLISYAVKLFVKAVGPEIGMLVAIAAIAVGAYMADFSATWSDNLMSLSTSLAKESSTAAQAGLKDVIAELNAQSTFYADSMDVLEEQRKALGLTFDYKGYSGLDFVGYRPLTVLGESSTDYYNRTIHVGNIGAASFDLTAGFFDAKLRLPSLSDTLTLEDSFDGLPV